MSTRAVRKRCRTLALAGITTAGKPAKHAAALRSWRQQMRLQQNLQKPGRHRRFRFDDPNLGNEFADLSDESTPIIDPQLSLTVDALGDTARALPPR